MSKLLTTFAAAAVLLSWKFVIPPGLLIIVAAPAEDVFSKFRPPPEVNPVLVITPLVVKAALSALLEFRKDRLPSVITKDDEKEESLIMPRPEKLSEGEFPFKSPIKLKE